jgi:soluble lytic murein transglycosylase-like protein
MMQGIQAVLGRIAQIEGRIQELQEPKPATAASDAGQSAFTAALGRAVGDGNAVSALAPAMVPESSATASLPAAAVAALSRPRVSAASPSKASSGPKAAIDAIVQRAAARHGLDPALVRSVITAESDYDPTCHSHAGAMGLMQLMPETCRDYGITDPYDIAQNIEGGCRELQEHMKQFGGNVELALAAYNAGPGAVRRYGGIPPFRETRAYVPKVMRMWRNGN